MTLQQLRYITALDQYRHFGKAAETCGLTQSTLSLMIKKLEEELDVLIFDRDTHPVTPTEIGRKIIDQAKVVLYNAEQIPQITQSEKETLTGPLRIGLISTVAPVLIPGLFKHVGQRFPSIALQTEEMLTETIMDKLRKVEVDMGILAGPVHEAEFLEIPLYHERFLAYVSPDNPNFAHKSIQSGTLLGQDVWIIRNGIRRLDPADLKEGRFTYERFFEGGRVGTLIQVVNDTGGITILPHKPDPVQPAELPPPHRQSRTKQDGVTDHPEGLHPRGETQCRNKSRPANHPGILAGRSGKERIH